MTAAFRYFFKLFRETIADNKILVIAHSPRCKLLILVFDELTRKILVLEMLFDDFELFSLFHNIRQTAGISAVMQI
jgi:hypothetical protein